LIRLPRHMKMEPSDCHFFWNNLPSAEPVRRMSIATGGENQPDEASPASDLLPAVYDELRRLAAALTQQLRPGQTLQATALVHEAYLRLVGDKDPGWQGRRHFFGAAARAMRQILIEQARRKGSHKHGGQGRRIELADGMAFIEPPADDLLALDEAIRKLQDDKPHLAEIVMLRYFTGLSVEETADVLGESVRTVYRDWRHARTWLALEMGDEMTR
jgi:RNA polymerase sigma factor (TIGR02999 family)